MSIKVYPYKQGSRSARALADALGGRVLRLQGSRYRPRQGDVVINWGHSNPPAYVTHNQGQEVGLASCKRSSLIVLQAAGVQVPPFWSNLNDVPNDAYPLVCRTVLRGHSGIGISIANNAAEAVRAPLYVKYIKKQDEYRVHVVNGQVIAVQRKALREGFEAPNFQVRNHHNGFVFVRNGFVTPEQVTQQSIMAVAALGLDFGAVDAVFNVRNQQAFILEVNTAPGLEGQTIEDYVNAFRQLRE